MLIIEEALIIEEVINFIIWNRTIKKKIDSILMMDNNNVGAEIMNPSMNMIIKKKLKKNSSIKKIGIKINLNNR